MFRILLFFFFNLLTLQVFSQECHNSYVGIVLDEHDLSPVTSAKVVFKELNKSYSTNSSGAFRIDSLCAGEHQVLFYHHIGCEPVKKKITLPLEVVDTIYLEYHYANDVTELNELVVVKVQQPVVPFLPTVHLDSKEAKLTTGDNLGAILGNLPGVTTMSSGATIQKPVMSGMYGNRIATIVEGVKLEGQQWGNEHAVEINSYLFDKITAIKGATSLMYGSDAIGGVLITDLSPVAAKLISGKANWGYASNGNQLFGNLKLGGRFASNKWSWIAQGAYKNGGTLSTPTYNLANTAMNELNSGIGFSYTGQKWHSHVVYSFNQSTNGIFQGAHAHDADELYEAMALSQPLINQKFTYKIDAPYLQTKHHLASWNNHLVLNDQNSLDISYSFQYNQRAEIHDHHDEEHEEEDEEHDQEEAEGLGFNLLTNQFSVKYNHQWHPQLEGVVGVDYTYQVNGSTGEYFIPNYLRNSGGVYLIENWQLKKNNEHHYLTGGARFDLAQLNVSGIQNDSVQRFSKMYSNLVGNVGYKYRHNHHLDFVAAIGNTYRIPTINELFSNGTHDATYMQGDRNLQPEKALFAQISTRYSSLKWNLSVNIYSYYFFNYIAYQAMSAPVITDHGALPSFEYKQTKANYSGIDLSFDINFTKWLNFQLKGALVRAFDLNTNAHLAYIPADRLQPALKFTHVTAKKDQFSAIIGASLVNRQYKAPVEYGFVKAPNGYVLMDVSFIYTLNYKGGEVDFIAKMENVFNTKYRDYMNRYRYFANDLGRNFAFKIQISF